MDIRQRLWSAAALSLVLAANISSTVESGLSDDAFDMMVLGVQAHCAFGFLCSAYVGWKARRHPEKPGWKALDEDLWGVICLPGLVVFPSAMLMGAMTQCSLEVINGAPLNGHRVSSFATFAIYAYGLLCVFRYMAQTVNRKVEDDNTDYEDEDEDEEDYEEEDEEDEEYEEYEEHEDEEGGGEPEQEVKP